MLNIYVFLIFDIFLHSIRKCRNISSLILSKQKVQNLRSIGRGEVPIMSIVWEHCPVSVNSMSMTTEPNKIYICMIFLSKYIFSPF